MSAKDKWVRRFSVDETARHKNGFTIYKITSVVSIIKVITTIYNYFIDYSVKKLEIDLFNIYRAETRKNFIIF